tara:strand:+ start:145 stop:441 length:297 start_codon:yes stop_codon:yes gene_type:complete
MKIYTKILFDKNNNVIEEESFHYVGKISHCGIHYDFKSTRGAKAMEKQAKREKKLAERRAKRAAKGGFKQTKSESNMHDISKPITLEDLTSPEKKNDK